MASGSKKVIIAAFFGNLLVAVTKFIAAAITGSSAILSEGIHSVVDTGNQALLLYGLKRAKKAPNEDFPFGYGKEIYFWSFVVAIMIFAVGAGVSIYEGVLHIKHPSPMQSPYVNYIVLTLAIIFEGVSWWIAFKEFNKSKGKRGIVEAVHVGKDPSLFVVFFEDSAAMAGLFIALFGILLTQVTGNPFYDGLASVLIGILLGATAAWLAYETKSLLIGESADKEVVRGIKELVGGYKNKGIEHVNEVLTLHMGPEFILVAVSIDFRNDLPAGEVENMIKEIDKTIKSGYPRVKKIFVEAEAKRAE